ncbi:hypothetical protein [Paenibacillus turpanensis]|uniref:hypothetical protein n=1 Tax=Paenibacillus turpanensis TaxID=2689078 RepID=UPI00140871A9|nr:hypothetical protein [Paenibacillus turpanensis]
MEKLENAVRLLERDSNEKHADPAKVPVPEIRWNDETIPVVRGSYCWSYKNSGTCADTAPPYELVKKNVPVAAAPNAELTITFDRPPVEFGINLWVNHQPKTADLRGNKLTLPAEEGIYIYDVYGHWPSGSASYAFAVEVKALEVTEDYLRALQTANGFLELGCLIRTGKG